LQFCIEYNQLVALNFSFFIQLINAFKKQQGQLVGYMCFFIDLER